MTLDALTAAAPGFAATIEGPGAFKLVGPAYIGRALLLRDKWEWTATAERFIGGGTVRTWQDAVSAIREVRT